MTGERLDPSDGAELLSLSTGGADQGLPFLRRAYEHALLLHWPVPPALLVPHVPRRLELDVFADSAWLGVVSAVAELLRPPLPVVVHELIVQTYVAGGGIHVLSIDVDHALTQWTGLRMFHLPYHRARMVQLRQDRTFATSSHRLPKSTPAAELTVTWTVGDELPPALPGSFEAFFSNRTSYQTQRHRIRIQSEREALHAVTLGGLHETIFASLGLERPSAPPRATYAADHALEIWPPRELG